MKSRYSETAAIDGRSMAEICRDAADILEKGLQLPPTGLQQEVDRVENLVARLRNRFIQRLRENAGQENAHWRRLLDEVNVAISLIAAVEYPATGINRVHTEQANDILRRLQRALGQTAS